MKILRSRKKYAKRQQGLHVPAGVERLYDRRRREWSIRYIDAFGNQCGNSYFTGVKSDALLVEASMRKDLQNERERAKAGW